MADEKPDGPSAVGTFGPPPTAKLIRVWEASIVATATTVCGFRTVRAGKRNNAALTR
jgi:hypothetical protein